MRGTRWFESGIGKGRLAVWLVGLGVVGLWAGAGAGPARGQTLLAVGETAHLDFSGTMPGASYHAPGDDDIYLHVSIGERRLSVMRGQEVLHRFPVAVGKGAYLRHRDAESGGWLFETPEGVFSVGRKEEDPVWYAPDWHFIEKGQPVPAASSARRYFPGEMGEYALYLGDGLAIHGTKVQASVGQAVSHGCMRLSKEGIATVYPLARVGTKVIITS
ncbi:MAG TPA: L,D-transpeptidase [Gemmatimonadota bacterium]|nr:L,D-transpeptidase [Gemmatimonadota bacterium]